MNYKPLLCVLLIGLSGWAEEPRIRIQFTAGEAQPAEKPGDEPRFPFKIEIINTSQQPIDLVAYQIMDRDVAPDDFISHTRNRIVFETKPALLEDGYQTMATERFDKRSVREMTCRLLPGKPLEINLRHNARRFMDEDRHSTREIPMPGLYEFTAHVPLREKGGKEIVYSSNAQKIPVGGSHERPRNCRAKMIAYNAGTGAATFEQTNPEFGNRVGDRFLLNEHLVATFVFEVTELEKGKFKAVQVEIRGISEFTNQKPLPQVGSHAEIQSEFDRQKTAD